MPTFNGLSKQKRVSLRLRYLIVAAFVVLVLMTGAIATHWHTQHVTNENTHSLTLRVEANHMLGTLRSALWQVDISLNTLLVTPLPEHEKVISSEFKVASDEVKRLLALVKDGHSYLYAAVSNLDADLARFKQKTSYLIEKRKDNDWVYPIIPFINQRLLASNNEFENAANIVLQSIADEDGRVYASERYGQFDTLRDLWRYKILNFRMLLIRFAGFGNTVASAQDVNIENAHEVIENKLAELYGVMKKGGLDFDSELALETMQQASRTWYANWQKVKEFRKKKVWRNDTYFMETEIRPIQKKIFIILSRIDKELLAMSGRNVESIRQTTNIVSKEIWGIFALSLAFLIGIYLMIDRSLLRPISKISNALFAEGEQAEYQISKHIGNQDSKEIHQLVSAFTTMRKQIHQRQEELQVQALHDALTGLPNRTLFNDRLEQAMKDMRRTQQKMAVMILDLDRFKDINDVLGHPMGDQLLQHVAQRLEDVVRESDTVARLGGDEFAIVAPFTDENSASQFAAKIVSAINDVFTIESQNLYVGVSIGIAVYPEHGDDADTLVRHADVAMYVAKRERQGLSFYKESLDKDNAEHLALVEALHNELENTVYLNLCYQPQIDLFTRELTGVEALLRWKHPVYGVISPERVVQIAEHSNQIDKLTDWVIRTALKEYRECKECNDIIDVDKLTFAINLSAKNVQDAELPARIASLLTKHGLPASSLKLEITESAVMSHPVHARKVMDELSAMNVKMSIDDYGTGFSSLGYLKMLPVDELKIDKTFVMNMLDDENDAIIVHSTIELAHNLGLKVVAEGVEDHAVMMELRALKCDTAQGYFISRPMSKQALSAWLKEYQQQVVNS